MTLTKYLGAPGLPQAVRVGMGMSGTLSYLASDGLSSVSEALDSSSGNVTAQQLYAPYGGARYTNGTMPGSKGFTGQRADSGSSGLDYYGARYYDPLLGQFASADTAADGLNRYGYVHGNPTTFTDPSGHYYCDSDCGTRPSPPGGSGSSGSSGSSGGGHKDPPPDPCGAHVGDGRGCVGTNADACKGMDHCIILGTGPDIIVFDHGVQMKVPATFDVLMGNFASWISGILNQLGGTIGFILFQAPDALIGADTLHGFLSVLSGYTGTISVVAHSNAAAALFTYMARSAGGAYGGDAVMANSPPWMLPRLSYRWSILSN